MSISAAVFFSALTLLFAIFAVIIGALTIVLGTGKGNKNRWLGSIFIVSGAVAALIFYWLVRSGTPWIGLGLIGMAGGVVGLAIAGGAFLLVVMWS